MKVVEIRATPGAPAVVWREDPICGHCGAPATVGVYHRSVSGRSSELIYWCEDYAQRIIELRDKDIGIGYEYSISTLRLTEVPSDFGGYFESLKDVTRL